MNEDLQTYARKILKKNLTLCTKSQQLLFKRMYSNGRTEMSIDWVVDNMGIGKLDWAMSQVKRTLIKNKGEGTK